MKNWIPGIASLNPDEPCALCGANLRRQLSHLVPKFVFQHAATRSPTGYLRTNINPNQRSQDGPKEYLLCRGCEQRLSRWEAVFAPRFKAQHANPGRTFNYGREEAFCALSILWRVLAHQRSHPEVAHLTFGQDYSRTDTAFSVWADVLLGRRENPGQFRIYWIWSDFVVNGPAYMNRYIFHACDFDVWANARESFAVAHLPGVFLIGALEGHRRSAFRGIDVSFQGGRYQGYGVKVAPFWLQSYVEHKMNARREAIEKLSPRQQAKIAQAVLADPEKALASPLFRAVLHDMRIRANQR